MNLKFPATDCLIGQDFSKGNGQAVSEEPLAGFTLNIKSWQEKESENIRRLVSTECEVGSAESPPRDNAIEDWEEKAKVKGLFHANS